MGLREIRRHKFILFNIYGLLICKATSLFIEERHVQQK